MTGAQVQKLKSLGLKAAYLTPVTVKKDSDEMTMKGIIILFIYLWTVRCFTK